MSWELDGRKGIAEIGNARLEGFALMRDPAKHLIAFHIDSRNGMGPSDHGSSTTEQFLIDEDAFEATELSPAREDPIDGKAHNSR